MCHQAGLTAFTSWSGGGSQQVCVLLCVTACVHSLLLSVFFMRCDRLCVGPAVPGLKTGFYRECHRYVNALLVPLGAAGRPV